MSYNIVVAPLHKKKAAKQFKEETTWNDGLLLRNVQILQRLEKSLGSTCDRQADPKS